MGRIIDLTEAVFQKLIRLALPTITCLCRWRTASDMAGGAVGRKQSPQWGLLGFPGLPRLSLWC